MTFFLEFENPPELSSKRIHAELQYSSFTPMKRQCSEMISENSDTIVNNAFEAADIQRNSLSPIQLPQSQQTRMIADKPSVLSMTRLQNEQVDTSKMIGNTVCHFKPICSHKNMSKQSSAYPNCFYLSLWRWRSSGFKSLKTFLNGTEENTLHLLLFYSCLQDMLKKYIFPLYVFVYSNTTLYVSKIQSLLCNLCNLIVCILFMFIYFVGDIKIYKEFILIFVLYAYSGHMHYYICFSS